MPLALVILYRNNYQGAVISSHSFDTLAVHLVVLVWPGEVQPGVPLLVDEQVGMVHFHELKLDRFDELFRDKLCGLMSELHGLGDGGDSELDHDRIGVPVDDFGVELVAVVNRVPVSKRRNC